jgi:4-hydroxybenzoate polyprenyltransferase
MRQTEKRDLREVVGGIFWLCHPVPVAFHVLAVMVLALLAGWPHVIWSTFTLVVSAHTAMQLSIAILNDYCDRHLDAASDREKPIPLGLVYPAEALFLGIFFFLFMIILLLFVNPLALLVSLLYFALGLSYNLGLKSTPLSGIIFALAIPLIPVYAFVGMGHLLPIVFWLVPVAALLGVALNLANSLPDLETDAIQKARTLAVVLGLRRSFLLCPLLIALCVLLIALLVLTQLTPTHAWMIIPTLGIACVLLSVMFLFFGPHKPASTRRLYFYLVVFASFVLAGGWLLGAII